MRAVDAKTPVEHARLKQLRVKRQLDTLVGHAGDVHGLRTTHTVGRRQWPRENLVAAALVEVCELDVEPAPEHREVKAGFHFRGDFGSERCVAHRRDGQSRDFRTTRDRIRERGQEGQRRRGARLEARLPHGRAQPELIEQPGLREP